MPGHFFGSDKFSGSAASLSASALLPLPLLSRSGWSCPGGGADDGSGDGVVDTDRGNAGGGGDSEELRREV
jgi:hypothetical protein